MMKNNMQEKIVPGAEPGFFGLGIAPRILEILDHIKFKTPTPIQLKAIPLAIEGKDVIGIAQTGTGKTHAFAIPMIQRLAQKEGMAVVLAPTRELAIQIDEAVRVLAHAFKMRTACLIGGAPMRPQEDALHRRPQIIIATPGRFIDHMESGRIMVAKVNMLVLDEADRMLDMGFAPQVERILKNMTRDRQTMLFSATIPVEIMQMIRTYMKLPVHVEIAPSGTAAEHVTQELYIVKREAKMSLLSRVLAQYHGSVLLFIRTKHSAHKIARAIREMGHRSAEIHSDKSLGQRREALEGFKSGRYRILVATDIAARGIDVTRIELVINYDLPEDVENYVHRIGRTGRAGCHGRAISFATPDQRNDVNSIERLIRMQLPVAKHPEVPAEEFSQPQRIAQFRSGRRGSGFGRYRRSGHGRFRRPA
jgi:ATP-dependent RNA helicase RhlE